MTTNVVVSVAVDNNKTLISALLLMLYKKGFRWTDGTSLGDERNTPCNLKVIIVDFLNRAACIGAKPHKLVTIDELCTLLAIWETQHPQISYYCRNLFDLVVNCKKSVEMSQLVKLAFNKAGMVWGAGGSLIDDNFDRGEKFLYCTPHGISRDDRVISTWQEVSVEELCFHLESYKPPIKFRGRDIIATNEDIKIGCQTLTRSYVETVYKFMKTNHVEKISAYGEENITLKEIEGLIAEAGWFV